MDELINRQVAIDAVTVWLNKARSPRNQSKYNDGEIAAYETAVLELKKIPSADRPQGEWKHLEGDEWVCSNCGYVVWTEGSWEHPLERGKNFCEHCGARM